jgi:23S rRNA (adenine2503-C2)-methyltransferase
MSEQQNPANELVALTGQSLEEMQAWVTSLGEKPFRARQIMRWLYVALESDFPAMANLPATLRERLAKRATISTLTPIVATASEDGQTDKTLFRLRDGETIETVLMRYIDRQTVCVSTQVGCPIGCSFCATGQSGYNRNLDAAEIVDQVLHYARGMAPQGLHVTNVVFMGMGEPLLNYEQVLRAIRILHEPEGFSLGARHYTISTVGVIPGIRSLAQEPLQVGLAISLHAPDDELRSDLVPLNEKYPIAELMDACADYVKRTGRRVTFEYALINKVNDQKERARALVRLLRGLSCHVNLIPLNPTPGSEYAPSSRERVVAFQRELRRARIPNSLRLRRGVDIAAGCGQLRSQVDAAQDANTSVEG